MENSTLDHTSGEPISTKSVGMKYGMILGVISIVFFLITVFGGLVGNQAVTYIGLIPTIILIVLAHKEFKKEGDGYMSYGQGLGLGMIVVTVSSLLYTIFFYVYVKIIDGSYIEVVKDMQLEQMQNDGVSEEQIEQAMSMTESFMQPEFMAVIALVVGVFFGFILSLIISAFTKNSNPDLDM